MKALSAILLVGSLLAFSGCSDDNENSSPVDETLNTAILTEFSSNIATSVYTDLKGKTTLLNTQILALETGGATDAELIAARNTWKEARQAWEQSEAFLFGPVSTEDIDPRIDTWPVNFTDLEAELQGSNTFTEDYIDNLEDALKGFHPIEYLLFGENGDKAAADLTARDIEYLKGLALNLKTLTGQLADEWDTVNSSSYYHAFINAGKGSAVYSSQRAALEEVVNSLAGICDEVANGKITEPFTQQDPSLEESPFAQSSIPDFTNNIKGVQNVYLGKYAADGKGLEDLVKKYNLQLDTDIKLKINNAIAALGNVTVPFGEAIFSQSIQVQNAIDAINELKDILEEQLLPFVQQHSN
jgi:putative iron-regulated protein